MVRNSIFGERFYCANNAIPFTHYSMKKQDVKITREIKNSGVPEYKKILQKSVPDFDGFITDYTMYARIYKKYDKVNYVFVFGDSDIYRPEDGYFDYECDSRREAYEWFTNYEGCSELSEDEIESYFD